MLTVAIQVIVSDVAVTMGGAEGNFELNALLASGIGRGARDAAVMAIRLTRAYFSWTTTGGPDLLSGCEGRRC
jgi:hypothetical protein